MRLFDVKNDEYKNENKVVKNVGCWKLESDTKIYVFFQKMSFDEDEDELIPGRCGEEELTLPRAAINKMIKEKIPNVRYANFLNWSCHF